MALVRGLLLSIIRGYQLAISPFLPHCCRFSPTCSEYAMEAIRQFGAGHGSWMSIRRIAKCHPFHEGGFDPVPCATDRVTGEEE